MAIGVRQIEAEVFACESVRITIQLPSSVRLAAHYRQMFPQPLPDTAQLGELHTRLNLCLGSVLFGVINPLGSAAKISAACQLGALRRANGVWSAVDSRATRSLSRVFGEKVLQRTRALARAL